MLRYSLGGDPMSAWLNMKNIVIITAILILTYGIYVPKSWRRVALVAATLAVLPFATLAVLYLRHPEAMGWLERGWMNRGATPVALFSFDAMLLLILAVGSAYGAHMISNLRRQVVEARQLGQYRLRRRIGAGGMGEVYLAEHQLLKRPCALKLIRPGRATDREVFERFEREVRLTATLSHPNTVEIYDYGRTEDGTYYYVMEYLPGLSLAELVERHGPLPPERAIYLLRQVCMARARGACDRVDPSRRQAVEHLRRPPRPDGRRGQAARLRPGPPRGQGPIAPPQRGWPDPRHAAIHVSGAGDRATGISTNGAISTR